LSINLVHHQIAIGIIGLGYVSSPSQIAPVSYDEAYGKGCEDTPDRNPDSTTEKFLLHFNPSTNFNKGLIKIIKWYQNKKS
jgi:UDP-glucose 4-epimerase